MSQRKTTCEGCGCNCKNCSDSVGSLHLHVEIENLKQRLLERENHIVSMETNFLREAEKFPNGEMAALTDELLTWQDKYSRLYESHKRVQKVNQNLEDKLLRIVDKCETEKNILTAEVATLTRRLVDEKFNVSKLQEENERYRNDVNLAIQLLQCKPSNFVPQKYDSLPNDLQQKVRSYVSSKRRISVSDNQQKPPEMKTIKVPIPTFPPTAMVYSVNKLTSDKENSGGNGNGEEKNSKQGGVDIVSAAIMAKVLEERERERSQMKHCDTCTCSVGTNAADNTSNNNNENSRHNKETQTVGDNSNSNFINNNSGNDLLINESVISSNINKLENSKIVNVGVLHSKEYLSCSNSTGNAVSSPMNIKRSKSIISSVNTTVPDPISLASVDRVTKEMETIQTMDFFTEFNMSPLAVSGMEETRPVTCDNGKKKTLNHVCNTNSLNSNSNPLLVYQNDNILSIEETDINQSHSCRVPLENDNCNSVNTNNNNVNIVGCNSNKDVNTHISNNDSDNLISFDKPIQGSPTTGVVLPVLTVLGGNLNVNANSNNRSGSIRHCSVRLQAGTSNILLDNVVDGPYAPVLYKSRPQPYDPLLVHTSPPRSISASSSISSFSNDDQVRYPTSDSVIANNNTGVNSSSSSTYSNSSSSSTPSSLSISSASLRKNNLTLAQIRTETEI